MSFGFCDYRSEIRRFIGLGRRLNKCMCKFYYRYLVNLYDKRDKERKKGRRKERDE